jgi:hypothetical protein
MTPQQYSAAKSLLRTVNGGTDIGAWARGITGRADKGLPVNRDDLAVARELLTMTKKINRKK